MSLSEQSMTHDPYYETMYILRPDIPEEEVESHLTKYRDMLVETGAEVLDNQMRGKRRLAYPIDKHKEGIMCSSATTAMASTWLFLKSDAFSEDVIRYLTVKQKAHCRPPGWYQAVSQHRSPSRSRKPSGVELERVVRCRAGDSVRSWILSTPSIRLHNPIG